MAFGMGAVGLLQCDSTDSKLMDEVFLVMSRDADAKLSLHCKDYRPALEELWGGA